MTYRPAAPPPMPEDQSSLSDWIETELQAIADALAEMDDLRVTVRSTSPLRPRSGMVTYADSVNWNPGSGAGFYGYTYSGSISSWTRF